MGKYKKKKRSQAADKKLNSKQHQSSQPLLTCIDDKQYLIQAKHGWETNLAFLKSLRECRQGNYVNPKDLTGLGIICSDLDLRSGKSSNESDVFITPFPMEKLHALLDEKKPFTIRELIDPPGNDNIYDALEVLSLIKVYLSCSVRKEDPGLMYEKTDWRQRGMEWEEGERLVQRGVGYDWRVDLIFDKMDCSTPHVSPILSDHTPMQDDKLSFAEICCILLCTARRFRMTEYHRHRIIPVTVVSLSGRLARIVHGYVDVLAGKLRVFKSPILDVDKKDNRQEMETLVSWCIGQPNGSTTW